MPNPLTLDPEQYVVLTAVLVALLPDPTTIAVALPTPPPIDRGLVVNE